MKVDIGYIEMKRRIDKIARIETIRSGIKKLKIWKRIKRAKDFSLVKR